MFLGAKSKPLVEKHIVNLSKCDHTPLAVGSKPAQTIHAPQNVNKYPTSPAGVVQRVYKKMAAIFSELKKKLRS